MALSQISTLVFHECSLPDLDSASVVNSSHMTTLRFFTCSCVERRGTVAFSVSRSLTSAINRKESKPSLTSPRVRVTRVNRSIYTVRGVDIIVYIISPSSVKSFHI